jgi:hypothetical protein
VQAGIDLDRMLVVRPPAEAARTVAVKICASEAFELVVIDMRIRVDVGEARARRPQTRSLRDDVFIRKLAVTQTRTLVLTDHSVRKSVPWPTALCVDLQRHKNGSQSGITARIVKERHGLIGKERTLRSVPWLEPAHAFSRTFSIEAA